MDKSLKQIALYLQEKRIMDLRCFADGYGYGVLHFNNSNDKWEFSNGQVGGSFVANDEFIEKILLENKKAITKEYASCQR